MTKRVRVLKEMPCLMPGEYGVPYGSVWLVGKDNFITPKNIELMVEQGWLEWVEEKKYPCDRCGKLRTKDEGGTTFTVCDDCWDKWQKEEEVEEENSLEDKF